MLISVSFPINAPQVRVFDTCRNVLSLIVARGGNPAAESSEIGCGDKFDVRIPRRGGVTEYCCDILACDEPDRFAFRLSNKTQSYNVEFHLRAAESDVEGATILDCQCDIAFASRFHRFLARVCGWEIRRQFVQQTYALKAIAESDTGLPRTPPMRRGLWQRPHDHYQGLVEACAPGTHKAAITLLLKHVKPGGAVLDLGAGSGAWLARLHDAGFRTLSAVELNVDFFGFKGTEPLPLDLNQPFSEAFDSRFELITALEIVEHLDCPRHFLRQVRRLLADDGHALLTMPNVGQWAGRLRFLLRGEHLFFEEPDYEQRHVSAVTDLHMSLMFSEIGFRLIERISAGSFDGPAKKTVLAPLALTFRLLLGPRTRGDVNIYLVAKDTPSASLFGRDSNYNRRIARILANRGGNAGSRSGSRYQPARRQ